MCRHCVSFKDPRIQNLHQERIRRMHIEVLKNSMLWLGVALILLGLVLLWNRQVPKLAPQQISELCITILPCPIMV